MTWIKSSIIDGLTNKTALLRQINYAAHIVIIKGEAIYKSCDFPHPI